MAGHHQNQNEPAAPRRLSINEVVDYAKESLSGLLGRPCESASSVTRAEQGWTLALEVLEVQRVPSTTDILATYIVELDQHGEMLGYERVGRYSRSQMLDQSRDLA